MAHEFHDDDRVYLAWIVAHPSGFVLNTTRGESANYMVLHRATCPTINQYNEMSQPGGFTERDYVKVCGETVEELREWVRQHGRPDGTFSSDSCHCDPPGATA